MTYKIDQNLLDKAYNILHNRKGIYWVIGGSCAGKSTICNALSNKYNIPLYDMDVYIFEKYQSRYTDERHPANRAWFTAENSLAWALSFPSWEANNEFYKATNVEYMDLFSEDMENMDPDQVILVDGGITNPEVLAKVLPAKQIICLKTKDSICTMTWEENEVRKQMKEMIMQLPNPKETWEKFLDINILMNGQIEKECRESGIEIYFRDEKTTVEEMLDAAANRFNLK